MKLRCKFKHPSFRLTFHTSPAPLLLSSRSNGDARSIEQNGLFLGMFPEAAYSSLEIPLRPDDRYVLYTDGLPESRNAAGEEFGLARCKQFLESYP